MLMILLGSRPYKSTIKNTLESINETVVLFLLLLSWMMFLSIEVSPDIEEGLLTYDRFGYVFTVTLVGCIAINFLRILCAVCVSSKRKYARKY